MPPQQPAPFPDHGESPHGESPRQFPAAGAPRPGPGQDGAANRAPAAGAPNATALFKAFRRRWLLATTLGLLFAAAAAAAVWFLFPAAKHTVYALLTVSANQPNIVFPNPESRADFQSYRKTQMTLVKSRWVMRAALRDPKVKGLRILEKVHDPEQWLEAEIKTDYTLGPEILRVSMSGDDPEDLKVLVEAVKTAYLREIVGKEHEHRFSRHKQLREIYSSYEDKLRAKRRALKELAEALGSRDAKTTAIKQQIVLEKLGIAQKSLAQLGADVTRLKVELATKILEVEKAAKAPIAEEELEDLITKDPVIQKHRKQLAEEEGRLEEQRRVLNRSAFAARSQVTRDRIEATKKAIADRRSELRPALIKELRDRKRRQAEASGAAVQERIKFLERLEKSLQQDVDTLAKQTRNIEKKSLEMEDLNEEIAQAEAVMKRVGGEAEALEVERGAPPRVAALGETIISNPDNFKRKLLATGGAGLLVLGAVVFGVTWREFRSRRLNSVDEVVQELGMNVVATLPNLPARVRHRASLPHRPRDRFWHSLLTESVDAMRTMLLHTANKEPLRVIMITSAMGGEGKTSLASHLAVSLARARRKTLLIDGDLRNPSVHRLFGLPREPGFCDILRKEIALPEAVQVTPVHGLSVIPAGRSDAAALQELSQDSCGQVFAQLKAEYDFVVVDSCPILPVVDTLLLAPHMDGVLFSILHEVSQFPKVYAAHQRLTTLGVRILGAVVNGTPDNDLYGSNYHYLAGASAEA